MSNVPKYSVYVLSDPDTGEVRYVGQTQRSLTLRLTEHLQDTKRHKRYSSNWIKSLNGRKPAIESVEECSSQIECDEVEQFYIDYFRFLGFSLTNLTGGGKGTVRDVFVTEKMRETSRYTHLGVKRSPETCAKISAARTGSTMPPRSLEYRANARARRLGKQLSDSTRQKLSKARGGRSVLNVTTGQVFSTTADAARALGVRPQQIKPVLQGKRKTVHGCIFQYLGEK